LRNRIVCLPGSVRFDVRIEAADAACDKPCARRHHGVVPSSAPIGWELRADNLVSERRATWLALREAADRRARADVLTRMLRRYLGGRRDVTIVDLAGGTGANLRHTAPQLGGVQIWHMRDPNPANVAAAPATLAGWAARAGHEVHDIASGLAIHGGGFSAYVTVAHGDLTADPLPVDGADVVTAAALIDRVREAWLRRLIDACAAQRAAVFLPLAFDGRITWWPADDLDAQVRAGINRDFGDDGRGHSPLGPLAAERAAALLRQAGYDVETAASDWQLDETEAELQQHLHAAWASAASAAQPDHAGEVSAWLGRRMDLLAAGTSSLRVGHTDVLGLPL
jgi:hypothetical protein